MRVLHGPVNVGNHAWALSRAERNIGLASDLVVNSPSWPWYPADRFLSDGKQSFWSKARRLLFGLSAPFRYDVIHYYFGKTFLRPELVNLGNSPLTYIFLADVFLAKALGRKVFMTLQGCDARIAGSSNSRNEWTMCAAGRCRYFGTCITETDSRRQGMIDNLLPLMTGVFFVNPEIGHEVPNGQFIPYANVDLKDIVPTPPAVMGRPLIVHAPSESSIKGTPLILNALEQLRSRYDFDLEIVTGKSHAEAMEIYRRADIAIDQIFAGWYGGFAVELMAMGKPVACYIRQSDMRFVPLAMQQDLPFFQLNPSQLVEDLSLMLEQRQVWRARGEASRAFVEKWHDPVRMAEALKPIYSGGSIDFVLD